MSEMEPDSSNNVLDPTEQISDPSKEFVGNESTGKDSAGDESAGKDSAGDESAGKGSAGDESVGKGSAGDESVGKGSAGDESAGKDSAGDESAGKDSAGDESAGKESAGDESAGKESAGDESAGKESAGDESAGKESAGKESAGDETSGTVRQNNDRKSKVGSPSSTDDDIKRGYVETFYTPHISEETQKDGAQNRSSDEANKETEVKPHFINVDKLRKVLNKERQIDGVLSWIIHPSDKDLQEKIFNDNKNQENLWEVEVEPEGSDEENEWVKIGPLGVKVDERYTKDSTEKNLQVKEDCKKNSDIPLVKDDNQLEEDFAEFLPGEFSKNAFPLCIRNFIFNDLIEVI